MSPNGKALRDLIAADPSATLTGLGGMAITGMTADSRQVRPGMLFVAIPGNAGNGEDYAQDAVKRGAMAILCRKGALKGISEGITRIEVEDVRGAAARFAAAFYSPQPTHITLVTGTDGKSSTVEFIRQFWQAAGIPGAAIGTIGLRATVPLAGAYEAVNTTPDPIVLHQLLKRLAEEGIEYVALEASSHGLDQQRLSGLTPEVGVFTTFGQDHLDYHPSLDAYFAAKAKLFTERLPEGAAAVLNADSERIMSLSGVVAERGLRLFTFGSNAALENQRDAAWLIDAVPTAEGQQVRCELGGVRWEGIIPLYGRFQLMNVLAAALVLLAENISPEAIFGALPALTGVRGRLEHVASRHGAPIFVDYAHTAQALEQALSALRPHAEGELHLVFGCGGDRDKTKRPAMGAVAERLADHVIVTDDNPRQENAESIRREILRACPKAREIGDRREAIGTAIARLKEDDVLLIAGKGHETYQIVGTEKHPFDDAAIAREVADA